MSQFFTFDASLQFSDGGAKTATGIAQVASANVILDLGSGVTRGTAVFDVSALDVVTGDESYKLVLEFSNSATFASGIKEGPAITIGGDAAVLGDANDAVGRYTLPFNNEFPALTGGISAPNTVVYRYMRVRHVIAGTTPSITYIGFVGRQTIQ